MMTLAARENLSLFDNIHYLRRKEWLWVVCNTYDDESLHKFVKFV